MEINGPSGISGPHRIEPQRVAPQRSERTELGPKISDRAEISDVAQLLSKLDDVPDVRMDKVNELKQQIAAGGYETREKIERAVDRLLEELV